MRSLTPDSRCSRRTVRLNSTAPIPPRLLLKMNSAGVYDGQNAQRTHVLNDKDIIELHFS